MASPAAQMAVFDQLDAHHYEQFPDGFCRRPWPGEGPLLGVPDCQFVIVVTTPDGFRQRVGFAAYGDLVNFCKGHEPPWSAGGMALMFKVPIAALGSLRVIR
jgi:hypothetical protein